ncbi:hypothetical protein [Methanobacterium sp. MBAC-LM]|uniref:hypothetical protein n=1 Tax=Methanobacterium sp. MBAC-LM TaxID=3412034 RepID=UPI003C74D72C
MSGKRNSKNLSPELIIHERLNAEKIFIKKLEEQKKAYNEFLTQINTFIEYAKDQVKNNDDNKLRLEYLEIVGEEESLRDKIEVYLKKNDELITSIKRSDFK